MDDEVDEAHDLFYLIKMPEEPQHQPECEDSSRQGPVTPSKLQDLQLQSTSNNLAEKQKRDENPNLMSFGIQGAALHLQPCQNNSDSNNNLT